MKLIAIQAYSSLECLQLIVSLFLTNYHSNSDRLCGLLVRIPRYRSRAPGSILGATRFSEK
jgi:hypothetical protein